MARTLVMTLMVFCLPFAAFAEDSMSTVFEKIDDLLIKVDSGISLNTFAESYSELKIDYKHAKEDPNRTDNPLLNDRMKNILLQLEDYKNLWKVEETDKYRFVSTNHKFFKTYDLSQCYFFDSLHGSVYEIACSKKIIFDDLKPKVEKAKSAHFNGW